MPPPTTEEFLAVAHAENFDMGVESWRRARRHADLRWLSEGLEQLAQHRITQYILILQSIQSIRRQRFLALRAGDLEEAARLGALLDFTPHATLVEISTYLIEIQWRARLAADVVAGFDGERLAAEREQAAAVARWARWRDRMLTRVEHERQNDQAAGGQNQAPGGQRSLGSPFQPSVPRRRLSDDS
ncbi:uncharacterized protein LTR77_006797 [Saxophila tyrrhenica]|uniref:Uncharacterized protein n=1 Tax=Saxophila tyrrhenica TaxID=1690608 RepID=A0AAV9P6C0_9PEZI|nr:hypothetical protein LTR77_006797 [Saxophila tyrrhenica]